jgi:hypothetical protein
MPDLLDRIRSEMSTRLAELRPLVDEHTRLEAASQALDDAHGATLGSAAPAPAARSRSRRLNKTPATARKRAPRGANRLAVLRAAQDRPGATSAELATLSGVQRGTLQALLARLVKNGELQKQTLPTGRTGYAIGLPRPEAPADAPPAAGDVA